MKLRSLLGLLIALACGSPTDPAVAADYCPTTMAWTYVKFDGTWTETIVSPAENTAVLSFDGIPTSGIVTLEGRVLVNVELRYGGIVDTALAFLLGAASRVGGTYTARDGQLEFVFPQAVGVLSWEGTSSSPLPGGAVITTRFGRVDSMGEGAGTVKWEKCLGT